MTQASPPIERPYNLARLASAGDEVTLTATPDELRRVAEWAEVRSLETLSARIALKKLSANSFRYDAELRAELTQDCVVTLEPVHSTIERRIFRELHYGESTPLHSDVVVDADADEVREEISDLRYDLAAPLLEELALAIDPYPRAPGVTFSPPSDKGGQPDSPFAVLRKLKKP
jgi:uncharacterized metal-binding protein YceD (DUF177 family)